jgi:hypothetical protein
MISHISRHLLATAALTGTLIGALVATPDAAAAQLPGVDIGVTVGAAVPQGGFSDAAKTGLVINGLVGVRLPGILGFRGEILWSRSDLDNPLIREAGGGVPAPSGDVSGRVDLVGGIANVVISPPTPTVQPYLIAGAGLYRRRVAQNVSGAAQEIQEITATDSDLGVNGGLGVRFSLAGYAAFVEARYHTVQTESERTTFIPVAVGFAF